jgi:ATP-dependent helicase/nuclease subunit A
LVGQVPEPQLPKLAQKLGLAEDHSERLLKLVTGEAQAFFDSAAQAEVAIAGELPGIGPVFGQIDRFKVTDQEIWLLDFKSEQNVPTAIPEAYVNQLALYAALLSQQYPNRNLKAGILWTQSGALQWAENSALSRAVEKIAKPVP